MPTLLDWNPNFTSSSIRISLYRSPQRTQHRLLETSYLQLAIRSSKASTSFSLLSKHSLFHSHCMFHPHVSIMIPRYQEPPFIFIRIDLPASPASFHELTLLHFTHHHQDSNTSRTFFIALHFTFTFTFMVVYHSHVPVPLLFPLDSSHTPHCIH